jgi:spore maturation protein CgeB
MQLAFFGSSLVSAYWNGAATYYRGIIRALGEKGHEITFYEPDAYDRQKHRDMEDPEWARVVIYPATEDGVANALEQARSADFIVKASGVGVFDELLESEVVKLKKPGVSVIYWDVDAPATLERIENNPADPLKRLIPHFDLILTYGGGFPVVSAFCGLGAAGCIPVYNALDPSTHFPENPDPRFAADLTFIGNRLPDREARVEEFFLRPASKLPERTFSLGGSGWGDKSMTPNIRYLGHVYTKDHNVLNSSCMAVLNINRESMAKFGFSPPTRVFEAAGAGACIITDTWPGIEDFLEPGTEVLLADCSEGVISHLETLTPDTARCIGRAARERILAHHTYRHRATQLESILGCERSGNSL